MTVPCAVAAVFAAVRHGWRRVGLVGRGAWSPRCRLAQRFARMSTCGAVDCAPAGPLSLGRTPPEFLRSFQALSSDVGDLLGVDERHC